MGGWGGGGGGCWPIAGARQPVLCKRVGLDTASRELTPHAFLHGPGGGTKR